MSWNQLKWFVLSRVLCLCYNTNSNYPLCQVVCGYLKSIWKVLYLLGKDNCNFIFWSVCLFHRTSLQQSVFQAYRVKCSYSFMMNVSMWPKHMQPSIINPLRRVIFVIVISSKVKVSNKEFIIIIFPTSHNI